MDWGADRKVMIRICKSHIKTKFDKAYISKPTNHHWPLDEKIINPIHIKTSIQPKQSNTSKNKQLPIQPFPQ